MKNKHRGASCENCSKRFQSNEDLKLHLYSTDCGTACPKCDKKLLSEAFLNAHHLPTCKGKERCQKCGKGFGRRDNRFKHEARCKAAQQKSGEQASGTIIVPDDGTRQEQPMKDGAGNQTPLTGGTGLDDKKCETCGKEFDSKKEAKQHREEAERERKSMNWTVTKEDTVLKTFKTYKLVPEKEETFKYLEVIEFAINSAFTPIIREEVQKEKQIKVNVIAETKFLQASTNEPMDGYAYLRGEPVECLRTTNVEEEVIKPLVSKLFNTIEKFQAVESGWVLAGMNSIELEVTKVAPMHVGKRERRAVLDIPGWVMKAGRLVDVTCEREKEAQCFKWSVIAAQVDTGEETHIDVSSLEKYEELYDFSMMTFPVNIFADKQKQARILEKFERVNNIAVNIFAFDEDVLAGEEEEEEEEEERRDVERERGEEEEEEETEERKWERAQREYIYSCPQMDVYYLNTNRCSVCKAFMGRESTRQLCNKTHCSHAKNTFYKEMISSARRTWAGIAIGSVRKCKKCGVVGSTEANCPNRYCENSNARARIQEEEEEHLKRLIELETEVVQENVALHGGDRTLKAPAQRKRLAQFSRGIYPLRIAKTPCEHYVNLLLLTVKQSGRKGGVPDTITGEMEEEYDGESVEGELRQTYGINHHFVAIRDLDYLIPKQKYGLARRSFCCYRCLHAFAAYRDEKNRGECKRLQEHMALCKEVPEQRIRYPVYPEEKILKFTNTKKQVWHPFVAYADFESFLKPTEEMEKSEKSVAPGVIAEEEKTQRIKLQEHVAASYAFKIIGPESGWHRSIRLFPTHNDVEKQIKSGERVDVAEHFLDAILQEAEDIFETVISQCAPMLPLTEEQEKERETATVCHICEGDLADDTKCPPHRDHDHITGMYIGMAHQDCNMQRHIALSKWKLPVVFHNLKGYDSHLIIKAAKKRHGEIGCIPTNLERYIAFSIGRIQFMDSLAYVQASLENIVKDSPKTKSDFPFTRAEVLTPRQEQMDTDGEYVETMLQKGEFPYSYFDSIEKFHTTVKPARKDFKDVLSGREECDEKSYEKVTKIWELCNNFQDYHDIYLRQDVLLLADCMESMRKSLYKMYKLDILQYPTVASYSFDAMLRYTKVKLELLSEPDMYLFMENSIRGGTSYIAKRYAQANNPYMTDYDPAKEDVTLLYVDANNLYGLAMVQPLPIDGFTWLNAEEVEQLSEENEILALPDDGPTGYHFEVSCYIPDMYHDKYKDFPPLPENIVITEDMFTPFMREMWNERPDDTTRLAPNLFPKKKYTIHYRHLKFLLTRPQQQVRITKVHRILRYRQGRWLKPYIDANTEMRQKASVEGNKTGENRWKLQNNIIFGKCCENKRNRKSVKLVQTKAQANKVCSKPTYLRRNIIHPQLVAIESRRAVVDLNTAISVGNTILELSKLHMYKVYREMQGMFNTPYTSMSLLFTDTDSFLVEVRGTRNSKRYTDPYKIMLENYKLFDFTQYPPDCAQFQHLSPYMREFYRNNNRKVLGKMSDETKSRIIRKWVGLRSKLYCMEIEGMVKDNAVKHTNLVKKATAKGIKENVREKLNMQEYVLALCYTAGKHALQHEYCPPKTVELVKALEKGEEGPRKICIKQNAILSKKHSIGTYSIPKVALSGHDTKRAILDDNVHTLPHGHKDLRAITNCTAAMETYNGRVIRRGLPDAQLLAGVEWDDTNDMVAILEDNEQAHGHTDPRVITGSTGALETDSGRGIHRGIPEAELLAGVEWDDTDDIDGLDEEEEETVEEEEKRSAHKRAGVHTWLATKRSRETAGDTAVPSYKRARFSLPHGGSGKEKSKSEERVSETDSTWEVVPTPQFPENSMKAEIKIDEWNEYLGAGAQATDAGESAREREEEMDFSVEVPPSSQFLESSMQADLNTVDWSAYLGEPEEINTADVQGEVTMHNAVFADVDWWQYMLETPPILLTNRSFEQ